MYGEGAKPKVQKTGKLTAAVTVKFGRSELDLLKARAEAAAVPLRTYIRREVLGSAGVSRETALVLAEVGRTRELMARLWDASVRGELGFLRVDEIARAVDAIEGRVFIAWLMGGK